MPVVNCSLCMMPLLPIDIANNERICDECKQIEERLLDSAQSPVQWLATARFVRAAENYVSQLQTLVDIDILVREEYRESKRALEALLFPNPHTYAVVLSPEERALIGEAGNDEGRLGCAADYEENT